MLIVGRLGRAKGTIDPKPLCLVLQPHEFVFQRPPPPTDMPPATSCTLLAVVFRFSQKAILQPVESSHAPRLPVPRSHRVRTMVVWQNIPQPRSNHVQFAQPVRCRRVAATDARHFSCFCRTSCTCRQPGCRSGPTGPDGTLRPLRCSSRNARTQ